MNLCDFSGKTILVTGASGGIGSATAGLLSKLGARVILVARNKEKLEDIRSNLSGENHIVVPFDFVDVEEIPGFLSDTAQSYGLIDGLIHTAGIHQARPLRVLSAAKLEEIFKINVTSSLMLAKGFRQKLVSKRPASMVLVASIVALVGESGITPYAASKGAVLAATKSLAIELAHESIRVNCILPGVVKTPMSDFLFEKMGKEQVDKIRQLHPLGLGEPEDVANLAAFLLSDASRWMTGSGVVLDGGYTAA